MQQDTINPPQKIDQLGQRLIVLEGAYNVRDLGGYPTLDGRRLRWGRLFRGDGLHRLTHADRRILLDHNIRTVIDLRFAKEAADAPNQMMDMDGVRYEHLPLHDDAVAPAFNAKMSPTQLPQLLDEYYCSVLDHCQDRLKTLFGILASPSDQSCLYHCTAGKDRTGLVTMLVLAALKVPREIIVEDYMMTAEYAAPLLSKLSHQMVKQGINVEWHRRMLECSPRNINRAMDHLDRAYGGVRIYLQKIGITDTQIDNLREALITY